MKKAIIIAAVAGFLVPVGCGFVAMLLFSGKDSGCTHFLVYQLPYILCPVWIFGDGSGFWFVAMPFLNAATYAVLVFFLAQVWNASRSRT